MGTCSYLAILCVLIKRRKPQVYTSSPGTERIKRTGLEKRENMIACLSVFICLVLMLCFNVPTQIIGICYWAGFQPTLPESVSLIFHITWYVKSTANPLIFGLLNKPFRSELLKYRMFKGCCKKARETEQNITFSTTVRCAGTP